MATTTKPSSSTSAKSIADELSRENRPDSPVVQDLRRQTANAFVLYANYKHYHWQTYGPLFRDLHKLFDRLAADHRDLVCGVNHAFVGALADRLAPGATAVAVEPGTGCCVRVRTAGSP